MKIKKTGYINSPIKSIFEQYKSRPQKICIICDETKINYEEFLKKIIEFSKKLKNIKKEEKVLISISDPLNHIIAIYSCFYKSLVPIPYPDDNINELSSIAKETNASLIISDKYLNIRKKKLIFSFKDLVTVKSKVSKNNIKSPAILPEKIAMIYFTSGTTSGVNKGVLQSYKNLEFTKNNILKKTKITSDIFELICTPIFNAYWFGRLNSIFSTGGTIVLFSHSFNPITFFNYINKFKINAISGDTAIYLMLMKYFKPNLLKISKKILWIKIASQAMPVKEKKEIMKVFPNTRIVMGYGLTEAMRTTLLSFFDEKKYLASDGKPVEGISLKVLDNKNKNVGFKKIGHIFIKGDHVAKGYLQKKKLWESKIFDGYYKSGDLGSLNSKGYLYLKGREDDAINIGGRTVSLIEADNKLSKFIKKTSFISLGIDDPRKIYDKILVICIENKWQEKILWNKLRLRLFETVHKSLVPLEAYIIKKFSKTKNGKIIKSKIIDNIKNNKYSKLN
jgi:long-chain acyl-CoA synthetase